MSIFSVTTYSAQNNTLWNNFIAKAKNATFLFNRDFMDYHKVRFTDHSLLVFKAEKLVAVLPANKTEDTLHSHQGLSYGGLITASDLKLKDTLEVFNSILKFLEGESISTLKLKVLPSIYATTPNDETLYLLFLLKAKLERRDVLSVIDYRFLPKSISDNRKRGLKRAKEQDLIIKEDTNFKSFWNNVLCPNLKVTHNAKPTHTLDEVLTLKTNFPNNIRQFNVYKNEEIVAGATIFETKTVAHAQYISAKENRQELGSLDALFHYLVNEVFKDKQYFDFGISNENQGLNINEGLLYWKESFGARSVAHDFYSIDTKNHHLLNSIFI